MNSRKLCFIISSAKNFQNQTWNAHIHLLFLTLQNSSQEDKVNMQNDILARCWVLIQ